MNNAWVEKESSISPNWFAGFLLLMLLVSLDGLWTGEQAVTKNEIPGIHDRLYVQFTLCMPWVFSLLGGFIIWMSEKRRQMSRSIAGTLLLLLGIAVSSSYQLIGKFTFGR
jgi:uncharacterized membrane protein